MRFKHASSFLLLLVLQQFVSLIGLAQHKHVALPSSRPINPNPFALLNHFTGPCIVTTPFRAMKWKLGQ